MQRSFSCWIENFLALGHDHVLRTNLRIAFSKPRLRETRPFLASTFGSHHISLVNTVAETWNRLLTLDRGGGTSKVSPSTLVAHAVLPIVPTSERFGLVSSDHISSFGGLLTIKDDGEIEDVMLEMPINGAVSDEDVIATMGLDPATLAIHEGDSKTHLNPGKQKQQVTGVASASATTLTSGSSNDRNAGASGSAANQAIVTIFRLLF